MKKVSLKSLFPVLIFCACLSIWGCKEAATEETATEATEETTTEAVETSTEETETTAEALYICPMRCEGSESAEPGKCPGCGMDLVLISSLEEGAEDGHDHDHDHDHEN